MITSLFISAWSLAVVWVSKAYHLEHSAFLTMCQTYKDPSSRVRAARNDEEKKKFERKREEHKEVVVPKLLDSSDTTSSHNFNYSLFEMETPLVCGAPQDDFRI
uniref:Uncharacterized protein n=1 Tax=Strombidium inclinatum TaxID=197538 RepID=A0A7S3IQL6_9SPIT